MPNTITTAQLVETIRTTTHPQYDAADVDSLIWHAVLELSADEDGGINYGFDHGDEYFEQEALQITEHLAAQAKRDAADIREIIEQAVDEARINAINGITETVVRVDPYGRVTVVNEWNAGLVVSGDSAGPTDTIGTWDAADDVRSLPRCIAWIPTQATDAAVEHLVTSWEVALEELIAWRLNS